MLRRKMKKVLTLLVAGTIICSNLPVDAISMQVNAAEESQAEETLSVSFTNQYAEVGTALTASVTGAEDVTYKWIVDGKEVANATNSYTPTEADLEAWIEVVVTDGEETVSTKLYCSKLPVVYIETEGGASITSKVDYINATMKIQGNAEFNASKELYDGDIEIRGRGNTTWAYDKKPYKIKLDKKTDVFGMGKNKHWVLLANYLDESLMRNTLSYDLSGSMGMEQTSTVWVDVILNGEYVGNYQFCEQVRVDEDTRVNVFDWESFAEDSGAVIAETEGLDEDDLAEYMLENMDWITSGEVVFDGITYTISNYRDIEIPSINGGYILELDEYYDEVSKFKTDSGQPIMFKNPEFAYTNDDMMEYVRTYVQAFEDAVQSSEYTALYDGEEVHYSELYDFDALVDYWLVNEIFFNEELNKKSTYMYKEIDGLMIMGPVWDMDWTSGAEGTNAKAADQWATNYFNVNAQQDQWYKSLVQDPYFLMKAQERYWEIRNEQVQDMLDSIDGHYEYLKESGVADTERWQGYPYRYNSFETDVNELENWLNTHIAWMDIQMATEDSLAMSLGYKSDSVLQLALTDSDAKALERDTSANAPADGLVADGEGVKLTITGNQYVSGTAEIYVNSKKLADTVSVGTTAVSVDIPASALTAGVGEKDVIEVKVLDTWGVQAVNYVTVRETEEESCDHANTVIQNASAATCTQAGYTGDTYCTDCKTTIATGTTIEALDHSYGSWVIVKKATEEEEGLEKRVCANDETHVETRKIAKLPATSDPEQPVDPEQPEAPVGPEKPDTKPETPEPESPKTGDTNFVVGYVALMAMAIIAVILKRRRAV